MQRDIDPIEELLMKWADAVRNSGDQGLGYPAKASGCLIPSWIKDFEEMVEIADSEEIVKINASIESLSQPFQRIIYKHHKLAYMVWQFPNEDELYLQAVAAFALKHLQKTVAIGKGAI